jgi:hypothetical protein
MVKRLETLAIPPEVPSISLGRKDSKLLEEVARRVATQATPKVIDVDINKAAYLFYKGLPPTSSQKGDRICFLFPDNMKSRIYLEVYKANPSIALAESVAALLRLEAQVAEMRSRDNEKGGSVKTQ